MNKDAMQFILLNGRTMSLTKLTEATGLSSRIIKNFMDKNSIQNLRTQSKEQRQKAIESRARSEKRRLEKLKKDQEISWPKPMTTMSQAMRGKSYGGNIAIPGTANPVKVSAVYSLTIGTIKSSMG